MQESQINQIFPLNGNGEEGNQDCRRGFHARHNRPCSQVFFSKVAFLVGAPAGGVGESGGAAGVGDGDIGSSGSAGVAGDGDIDIGCSVVGGGVVGLRGSFGNFSGTSHCGLLSQCAVSLKMDQHLSTSKTHQAHSGFTPLAMQF